MKLDKYIELLVKCKKEHGGDIEVWYAVDDEGNSHEAIHYAPGVKVISKEEFDEKITDGVYDSVEEYIADTDEDESNAIKILLVN